MKKTSYLLFGAFTLCMAIAAKADHWPTGYYKQTGDNPVFYYDDEHRWYCSFQNASHLTSYNIADPVRVVGQIWDILNLGVNLNSCPWPDGFYMASDNQVVYRLTPGSICQISSPQMLDAYGATNSVVSTDAGSDFSAHRTNYGQCFWPN